MDARTGARTLVLLLANYRGPTDAADFEKAIGIAREKSPSAAFDAAMKYYQSRHGATAQMQALGFAKSTRWLAVLRRKEGDKAFSDVVAELRKATGVIASELTVEQRHGAEIIRLNDELMRLVSTVIRGPIRQALAFALDRHAGQYRIDDSEPYILHVLRVAVALARDSYGRPSSEILILVQAALLHDTLEDTATTEQELRERFGDAVARIVRAVSHGQEEEPDEVYLSRVAEAGQLAILVKRCDRLDNIRSLENAPESFRRKKFAEIERALPIWQRIDPEGARMIAEALKGAQRKEESDGNSGEGD